MKFGDVYKWRQSSRLPVIIGSTDKGRVQFLCDSELGDPDFPAVCLKRFTKETFDVIFASTIDPAAKIAPIYCEHATQLGATPEALDFLGNFITITNRIKTMAAAKKAETHAEAPKKTPKTTKASAPAETTSTKVAKTTVADKAPKTPKAEAPPKVKRPTVSGRICDLIMAGKLTDDQIFETVKAEFNLDDSKKGYVSWNRHHLKKIGSNPPEPVGGKKPSGGVAAKADKEAKAKAAEASAAPAKAPRKSAKA